MDIRIEPAPLFGRVRVPSSKSVTHRELIASALAEGETILEGVTVSEDIEATIRILGQLGAVIGPAGNGRLSIRGGLKQSVVPLSCDAGESGSTLRFLIPLGLLSGNAVTWTGRGRLSQRPLTPYYGLFREKNISFATSGGLPLMVEGKLESGAYGLPGDVSSQFFTGLLFALPLLDGDSLLKSTTPLESKSYVDLTVDALRRHGITVFEKEDAYEVPGGQSYRAGHFSVEGDASQAAFWLAAGICGGSVTCEGLSSDSRQGDRVIISLLQKMGASVTAEKEGVTASKSETKGIVIDAADCPDLVPVLAVLAAVSEGRTEIIRAGRVRLKECDRLHAMKEELTRLGAEVKEKPDGLVIDGKKELRGGTVSSWNDHRIAMALASVSSKCTGPLIIQGAEAVRKSYPSFWEEFRRLGGNHVSEK